MITTAPLNAAQVFFQPFDRGQVEVIGRLVQQQQIRLGRSAASPAPAASAARRTAWDALLPGFLGQANAQQRRLELVPPRVSAAGLEVVLNGLILLEDFVEGFASLDGHLVFELAHFMREVVKLRKRQLGFVHHGIGLIKNRILREVADLHAPGDGDDPRVRRHLPDEHFEERRFAASIGPHEPQAFPSLDIEVQSLKEDTAAESLFDGL